MMGAALAAAILITGCSDGDSAPTGGVSDAVIAEIVFADSLLASLTNLIELGLGNNQITDVAPLLPLVQLQALTLAGNDGIPCSQLEDLVASLGDAVISPSACARQ